MKMTNYKIYLLSLLLALTAGNTWAERVLISDDDQTVSLARPLECYRAAEINIDTARPEIYEPGSTQLQLLSDTVRAILNYECPDLSDIKITGLIRGLNDVVYQGELSKRNNWLVAPLAASTLSLSQLDKRQTFETPRWQSTKRNDYSSSEQLAVTNLELGMTVEEVSKIVSETFNVAPEYDAEQGLMTMLVGGCPVDFDVNVEAYEAKAQWKCLKAWFSDARIARLDRLELIQVVNNDTNRVQQKLIDKYGNPAESKVAQQDSKSQYIWHTEQGRAEAGQPAQSLSAELSETGTNLLVTSLKLYKQTANEQGSVNYADMGLRL